MTLSLTELPAELIDWLIHVLPIAIILSFGIFVQAAAGFAAGMLIVPTLLWCGYTIPAAQTALLVATVPQNIGGVWALRDNINPRQIVWPGLARITFFPIGIACLYWMESFPSDLMKQIVSAFILLATITTLLVRPTPRQRLHPAWSWLTFPLSGFFQGMVGMGGPVMVLWVQAHDWDSKRSRGFLFGMYLVSLLPAFIVLYLTFGERIIPPAITGIASLPLIWIATMLGLKVGSWMGRERLKAVTMTLLILIGLAGLLSP